MWLCAGFPGNKYFQATCVEWTPSKATTLQPFPSSLSLQDKVQLSCFTATDTAWGILPYSPRCNVPLIMSPWHVCQNSLCALVANGMTCDSSYWMHVMLRDVPNTDQDRQGVISLPSSFKFPSDTQSIPCLQIWTRKSRKTASHKSNESFMIAWCPRLTLSPKTWEKLHPIYACIRCR